MSDSKDRIKSEFLDREYRESYAAAHLDTTLATQIRVLRNQRGLSREQLSKMLGVGQSAIYRIENVNYGAWNINTLRKVANALGLRLSIRLDTFGSLIDEVSSFSEESLKRPAFEDDPAFLSTPPPFPTSLDANPLAMEGSAENAATPPLPSELADESVPMQGPRPYLEEAPSAPVAVAPSKPRAIFVSYSHKDKKWLDEIRTTLRQFIRSDRLVFWDDSHITPGASWRQEIEKQLQGASIALLLVSRYFFASDFIAENELPPLLEAANKRGVKILWIAVSDSLYKRSPIAIYQALNDPETPLDRMSKPRMNKALVEIAEQIYNIVHNS